MIDKNAAKKVFQKALEAEKATIASKYNTEQNIKVLREEFAKQEEILKDGSPDVNKVKKGMFVHALNFTLGIKPKDSVTEAFDFYELYKEKLKDGKLLKAECERYKRNMELQQEAKKIKKGILDEAKDIVGEEKIIALKEIVSIKIKDYEIKLKEDFQKNNGIESKTAPPKSNPLFDSVKELAELLDIELKLN